MHKWNEPLHAFSAPAAERHCTLSGIHFPSRCGRLSCPESTMIPSVGLYVMDHFSGGFVSVRVSMIDVERNHVRRGYLAR